MAKYAVCNLDKMSGTEDSSLLVSVKYFDDTDAPAAIENGSIVKLGTLLDGEREVRKATNPSASDAIKDLVLIANPEVIYDETVYHPLSDYTNEAGKVIRGYRFHANDGFSLTAEGFDGTPAKGKYAVVGTSNKLKVSDTATGTVIGLIDDVVVYRNETYYYVQVTM